MPIQQSTPNGGAALVRASDASVGDALAIVPAIMMVARIVRLIVLSP
jgi:hypothetical protein